tara:strand:+ start:37 stop:648 length:612 start_codon:yes stop_codon:yes gene_type:complete
MKKDDRINQIAEKTLELINNKGSVDALRTKDLADAIGASEATIFKFFESKEEILDTVIRRYIHRKPLKIQASDLKTLDDFENFLREILDTSLDTSPSRVPYVSLLIQISLKGNSIAQENFEDLKKIWAIIEDRIEYGKKNWNFSDSVDSKLQTRLFYFAAVMYYIQMEVFNRKSVESESFDVIEVKETLLANFLKILTEGNNQ